MPAARKPRAPVPAEGQVQIAIIDRLRLRGVAAIHIPNGGSRNPIEARKLKAQGVRAGAPDLICIGREGRVAWLEVKRPGYRPSDVKGSQHEMHDMLRARGHFVAIVTSQDEAEAAVREAGLIG